MAGRPGRPCRGGAGEGFLLSLHLVPLKRFNRSSSPSRSSLCTPHRYSSHFPRLFAAPSPSPPLRNFTLPALVDASSGHLYGSLTSSSTHLASLLKSQTVSTSDSGSFQGAHLPINSLTLSTASTDPALSYSSRSITPSDSLTCPFVALLPPSPHPRRISQHV
jgi:hypothetical protein